MCRAFLLLPGVVLVDGSITRGLDFADEENQRHHDGGKAAHEDDNVEVGQHGGLAMELVIEKGLRGGDSTGTAAAAKARHG